MNAKINTTASFAVALLFSGVLISSAEELDNVFEMTFEELMDVEVFSMGEVQPYPATPIKGDTTVYEISAADIAAGNARTVGDALRFVPGLFFTRGSQGTEGAVNIRGAEAMPLVMINNRPVSEPREGIFAFDEFPIDNVAKIKIIKGPVSAAYGANSMNGVINIITKKGKGEASGRAQFTRASQDTRDGWAEVGGEKGRFNYYFTGSWRVSDGFELSNDYEPTPFQDSGLRRESDYDRMNFSMNLGIDDLPGNGSLALLAGLYKADRGISPNASEATFRHKRWEDWQRVFVDLTGKADLTDTINLCGKLFYDNFINDMIIYGTTNRISYYDNDTVGGNLHAEWRVADALKVCGGGYVRRDTTSTRDSDSDPWEDNRIFTGDLFAEVRWEIIPTLAVTAGVNYDYFSGTESGQSLDSLTPRILMVFQPRQNTTLHAAYGKQSRFPTIRERAGSHGVISNTEINASLWETGVRQLFWDQRLELGCVYFFTETSDVISRDLNNWRHSDYENRYEERFQGVEVLSQLWLNDEISLTAAYVYTDAHNLTERFRLNERAYHQVNGRINYISSLGLSAFLQGSYSSGAYHLDAEEELGSFFLLNGKLSYNLSGVVPFVAIENILNENYETSFGYPQMGRTVTAGITVVF